LVGRSLKNLPMKSNVYVPTVSAAGLLVIGHCISTLIQQPVDLEWIALAVLTLFTGSLTIRIPSVAARLSVSETFVFASVLLFGTCAGTITVAIEISIAVLVLGTTQKANPQKIIFNLASAALSIWMASNVFYYTAGIGPLASHEAQLHTLIFPLAALSTTYFICNSGFIAIALALERRESAIVIWRTNFLGLGVNYFAGASLAALFVSYTRTIDLFALSVIVPLLVVSYLTFKTSLGRIEDATKHVDEVNRLYLSTIETLATAIDAKDQVTHGHIRRVQQLALGLARQIGVRDKPQLQALEAAALLHDTGKLVIPEHILNKPGKLTRGEFEKMKGHASVGAEILSSIKFPYPVVPIVRHHHENWDGTGYPDGLRGTDIPLGARILAVVDCFDALTSDRPYRPRMTDAEAISILAQRRGTMYDPLVIDTFLAKWEQLAAEIITPSTDFKSPTIARVVETPSTSDTPHSHEHIAASEPFFQVVGAAVRTTGAAFAVLFGVDSDSDRLVSLAAMTSEGVSTDTVSMPLGSGVSGWVAVTGTMVINAEPVLDFQQPSYRANLVRIICVPIRISGTIVGVISAYSTDKRGFSSDDTVLLSSLAASLDTEAIASSFFRVLQVRRKADISTTIH